LKFNKFRNATKGVCGTGAPDAPGGQFEKGGQADYRPRFASNR